MSSLNHNFKEEANPVNVHQCLFEQRMLSYILKRSIADVRVTSCFRQLRTPPPGCLRVFTGQNIRNTTFAVNDIYYILCSHHRYLVPGDFITLKRNPGPNNTLPPQRRIATNLLSVSVDLPVPGIS